MKKLLTGLSVIALLSGCTSHEFIKTGAHDGYQPKHENCGAHIFRSAPKGQDFIELGLCMATSPGGGVISDNTPDAVRELQKCTCLQGGDAVILQNMSENGTVGSAFGTSQQQVKVTGIAIKYK